MRLVQGKVAPIAVEVVRVLLADGDIDAEQPKEVEHDVSSVLGQYLTDEKQVSERARDVLQRTGKPHSDLARVRQLVAEERGIKVGDETLDYLLDQVVEMLMHSNNVDEVFVEDVELRRKMAPIFKKHMIVNAEVDEEVRAQLKHVREGTREWEVEYGRMLEQVRRRRGL